MVLDSGKARGLDGYERHPRNNRHPTYGPIYSCKSERCLSRFHGRKLKIHQNGPYESLFTIRRILRCGRWSQIMTLLVSAWSPFLLR
ncbi:uncharacterized protein ARMOST_16465 [Armillaria ostoyae]|uniref:Uncharacterized protein n=1 Tax=Armillaria ostoyae TaxID=47428 RepID=A0A284RWA5_ARMOS|nr:uncharacterized protein ARMOST_16465 [Armillaria ostoyae]